MSTDVPSTSKKTIRLPEFDPLRYNFGSSKSHSRSNSTISSRLSTVRKKILSLKPKSLSKALRKNKSKVSKLGGIVIPKHMKHSCGQSKRRLPNLKFSVPITPSTSGKVSKIRMASNP